MLALPDGREDVVAESIAHSLAAALPGLAAAPGPVLEQLRPVWEALPSDLLVPTVAVWRAACALPGAEGRQFVHDIIGRVRALPGDFENTLEDYCDTCAARFVLERDDEMAREAALAFVPLCRGADPQDVVGVARVICLFLQSGVCGLDAVAAALERDSLSAAATASHPWLVVVETLTKMALCASRAFGCGQPPPAELREIAAQAAAHGLLVAKWLWAVGVFALHDSAEVAKLAGQTANPELREIMPWLDSELAASYPMVVWASSVQSCP